MGLNVKTFCFLAGALALGSALVYAGNVLIHKAKTLPPASSTTK